jgi:chemotaxis protein CheD
MPESEKALPEVYVQPGESHMVQAPSILRTVLGSCVGITFLAPRLGIAAICHPMLPSYPSKPRTELSLADSRRYVDFAIHDLACQFDSLGAHRDEILVKLFGGGDVLFVQEASRPTVGKMNCKSALITLLDEGLDVVASSIRGDSGLKIQFHTGTGEVLLWRLGYSIFGIGVDQS